MPWCLQGSQLLAMITLLYDTQLRRPACVLLQAVAGGDMNALNRLFDASVWLLAPTPGMKRITGTDEEWERAAKMKPRDEPPKVDRAA